MGDLKKWGGKNIEVAFQPIVCAFLNCAETMSSFTKRRGHKMCFQQVFEQYVDVESTLKPLLA